jgi:Secretion system C-terminal sorting domain
MKQILLIFIVLFIYMKIKAEDYDRSYKPDSIIFLVSDKDLQPLYSPNPNHREIVLKSLELAISAGFIDPSGIPLQEIQDRLESGAYSEDFEMIPGIIGEHFPVPWNQGPDFNFYGLYPFSKIPYGSYTDTLSGWFRGLNHGYDPVQNFIWPGADATTVDWANSPINSFTWNTMISLYNSGEEEKAYECLGHLLHLLADLSVPSHVKVVDHGISINSINNGTVIDPDLLDLIVDEYELALAGGIPLPGILYIPDLSTEFTNALSLVDSSNIPIYPNWADYFTNLGQLTYMEQNVNQFYAAPLQNGEWGAALNENGSVVNPTQYGITPPVELNGRWVQVTFKSTANANGTILPDSKMIELCNALVPKAVEFGAGLLLYFHKIITDVNNDQNYTEDFQLFQNYPNPFNPSTKISYQLPVNSNITLKVYDVIGNEVATLLDEYKPSGSYEVEFNVASHSGKGRNLTSGIYFYRLQAGDLIETKKMILMK